MPYANPYPKNCASCNRPITHRSTVCRMCNLTGRKGSAHPSWKGDAALPQTGRARAKKLFPSPLACERCGNSRRTFRHHRDRNTLNNNRSNIEHLCMSCHRYEHVQDTKPEIADV